MKRFMPLLGLAAWIALTSIVHVAIAHAGIVPADIAQTIKIGALRAEANGTVAAIHIDKNELIVNDQHGRRWSFHLSRVAKITINNRPARLVELGPGDIVRVIYEQHGKQNMAVEIHAMQM